MFRHILLLLPVTACVAAPTPPAAPVPSPCLVLEPEPCEAITAEERRVLAVVAEVLQIDTTDPSAALRTLAGERAYAIIETERLGQELEDCKQTNEELVVRIAQLESHLEELKRLAIEMEMKAK